MAYKPPSQTVTDDDIYGQPSSEAVFELAKEKADVDLGNLSLSGVEGQVLTLGASGPYWEDVAASGGGGSAEYPPQAGNAGKFLQTDGSDVSWQSVTGFEPEVSLTADRVVISNASGKLAVSSVTPTTLSYLDVSSSVTGLLNQKANVALSNLSGTTAINQSLLFQSDDTYDIGASADFRPANVYVTQSLQVPIIHPVDGVGSAFHDLLVRGGNGLTGNHHGGDVTLAGGLKNGTGSDGELIVKTSDAERLRVNASGVVTIENLTSSRVLQTGSTKNLESSNVSTTELGHLSGVSGAIQTQINSKQNTITGAATTITSSDLTASRVLVSDASGKVSAASVTASTLAFLDATSSVQTQLNAKEPTLTKGNLTESTSSVLTITGGTGSVIGSGTSIQVKQSSGSQSGFLSSSDFTTFSSKQNAITGAATTITSSDLTASRVLVSDASGKVSAASVTATTLGFLDATSSVQTQLNGKQATITGGATTITTSNLTASRALVSDGSGKVAVASVTSTELGYVSGVTSAIQTQFSGKQDTITGAATTITSSNLTASRALISNASGKVEVSAVTSATLAFLDATSSVQTQLNGKEPTVTKGNLTESTSSVLTITGGTGAVIGSGTSIQVRQSSSTVSGFLSSTDWSTFNGKQNAITGAATTITTSNLTVSRALSSDASGKVAVATTTLAELNHLSGVTSAVQTQLNARVPFTTATVSTTTATETTLETIATTSNTTLGIECKVAARRTGGTAGATGDAAYYILKARAKNISGTVTLSTVTSTEFEDQSGWNADLSVSGTNVLLRVTGATNNNIDWKSTTTTIQV